MKKILRNIYLIGYMGTGKTTVASGIANLLGMTAIDMDSAIEEKEDMTINDIFTEKGEKYFRDAETQTLQSLEHKKNIVVSCGGGIVLKEENTRYLKKFGKVVLLNSTAETIYDRVKICDKRPLLNNNMSIDFIENMMKNRFEKYVQTADIIINNEKKSVDDVVKEIVDKL